MAHTAKEWIISTRPWSFPASSMPALIAITFIFYSSNNFSDINWFYGALALLGAVIFQIVGNLISDYYDYKYTVDRKESFGSSRMLVDKVFQPKSIFRFGILFLLIGSALGLFLLFNTGTELLWIGIFGSLGAVFYYKMKYVALGDLLIFLIYGPLIGIGTAYVMTNQLYWQVLLIELPIAFLIVNILHANNTRDIRDDSKANIKTQAMLLGIKGSKVQYFVLSIGAYLLVATFVFLNLLHPFSLIVLVTIPLTIKNIKAMNKAKIDTPELIKNLDATSAQLVMIFSLLLSLSNVLGNII